MIKRSFCYLTAGLLWTGLAFGEIYKTIDQNGNVVYTDEPPTAGAQPMDLPDLSVVTPREPMRVGEAGSNADDRAEESEPQGFGEFRIVSPASDQTYWGTGNAMTVALKTDRPVNPNVDVIVYINDTPMPASKSMSTRVTGIPRGTHTLRAELHSPNGQVLAVAGPVTFHMKQHSANFNRSAGSG